VFTQPLKLSSNQMPHRGKNMAASWHWQTDCCLALAVRCHFSYCFLQPRNVN